MSQRVLYFDLVGGAAGDMVMAALVDLGAPLDTIREAWAAMGLTRVSVEAVPVNPAGLRALSLDVLIDGTLADTGVPEGTSKLLSRSSAPGPEEPGRADHGHHHGRHHREPSPSRDSIADHHHHDGHRPYREIRALLETSGLPERVVAISLETFRRLAIAEAQAHGIEPEDVVFHEVGADDAIADVVGAATALNALRVDRVVVSPFPLGQGLTRGGHGPIPLPGPATLHLLQGAPTVGTPLIGETVTPTGAAILMTVADDFGPSPPMVLEGVGTGAGHKRWPDRPNVVRAMLGTSSTIAGEARSDDVVIEANIDDMRAEDLAPLLSALFTAGAADAWAEPLYMKKGRPGLKVCALVRESLQTVVVDAFWLHSTTLGVRSFPVRRYRSERRMVTVETEFGSVRVKLAPRPDGSLLAAPEHDDCVERAEAAQVAVRRVYEAALRRAWASS